MNIMILAAVCLAIGSFGQAQGAMRLTYEQARLRISPGGNGIANRKITVIRIDGERVSGRRMGLYPDHVGVDQNDNSLIEVPTEKIASIEIRQKGRFFHYVADAGVFTGAVTAGSCGKNGEPLACGIALTLLDPPLGAWTAAIAPVLFAAEAVALFTPAKVYEIIH